MKIESIFQLLKMRKNNFLKKLKILARESCVICSGKGHHEQSLFGYSAHDVEICECVEQSLTDAGTAWASRNLNKYDEFSGLGKGGARTPMLTDNYIFFCQSCNRTYELIERVMGVMVNGKKEFMGGIHYHQLPSLGKEHVECPNCVHGENTVRTVVYQPNGRLLGMTITSELEKIYEGRTNR